MTTGPIEFLDFAICAGARIMLDTLHVKTAKLPLGSLAARTALFAAPTEQRSRRASITEVEGCQGGTVSKNYATYSGQWPELIATCWRCSDTV